MGVVFINVNFIMPMCFSMFLIIWWCPHRWKYYICHIYEAYW